jgi:hypothetical protein
LYRGADGSRTRPQCGVFRECGEAFTKGKMDAGREAQLIAANNLVRKAGSPPTGNVPPQYAQNVAMHVPNVVDTPAYTQRIHQTPQYPMAQPVTHYAPAPVHVAPVYQQMYAPTPNYVSAGYAIPSPTTVAEDVDEGSFAEFAFRSILRSMVKGAAHSVAHIADAYPLRRRRIK